MIRFSSGVIVCITWAFAGQLYAHHGLQEYDTELFVEFTGTVVGFELMDPHSLLYVDVENADGTTTSWVVEGGGAHGIISAGLTREMLSSRPAVKILGYQSRDKKCQPCRAAGREFEFD